MPIAIIKDVLSFSSEDAVLYSHLNNQMSSFS